MATSLKAYPTNWLLNIERQRCIRRWQAESLLEPTVADMLKERFGELPYQTSWFMRLGLVALTLFCVSSATGLMALFWSYEEVTTLFFTVYGLVLYVILNRLIRSFRLYFSGVDNVLLYCILGCFAPLVLDLYEGLGDAPWLLGFLYLPLLIFLVLRYGEPVIAAGTFLTGMFILASWSLSFSLGKSLLPFVLGVYSLLSVVGMYILGKKESYFYWKTAIQTVRWVAAICLYVSLQYAVVEEVSILIADPSSIPMDAFFSGFFFGSTALIPFLYVWLGLRSRDVAWLWLGSLCLMASLVTWLYYYPWLSYAGALAFFGGIVLGGSLWLVRWLQVPRAGWVYRSEESSEWNLILDTAVASQLGGVSNAAPSSSTSLGGGDFGGGGAGQGY